jgi:hypothetical protein
LFAIGFSTSLWLAYQHAYGPTVSVPVGLGALLVITAGLIGYGRAQVAVDTGTFLAGRARVPLWAVGEVTALTADQAKAERGQAADPRAYLFIRSYAPNAVRVVIDDPADPVPYWLVSSRRPDRLADALIAARDAAGHSQPSGEAKRRSRDR